MESKRNALQRAWRSGGVIDGDTIFVKFTFHGVIRVRMEIRCCFVYYEFYQPICTALNDRYRNKFFNFRFNNFAEPDTFS